MQYNVKILVAKLDSNGEVSIPEGWEPVEAKPVSGGKWQITLLKDNSDDSRPSRPGLYDPKCGCNGRCNV